MGRQNRHNAVSCYCLTYPACCHFRLTDVLNGYLRKTWLVMAAGGLQLMPLYADSLNAVPLSGAGNYEFLFFAGEKKPEIEGLTARFAELGPELQQLQTELRKAETEISGLGAQAPGKKSTRLEWSPIEGVSGYSIKLFDAAKKPLASYQSEANTFAVELEPGDYYFQVAAVTKYKTGTYSRITPLKVSKGKPSAAQLAAEERAEQLREKIRIQKSIRGEYLRTLRAAALGALTATEAKAELPAPAGAVVYLAVNKNTEPYSMSSVSVIPGRLVQQAPGMNPAAASADSHAFYWGAGFIAGIQDTKLDFFRVSFGAEGFLRYDRAFFRFFYPQLKTQVAYSSARTNVYDAMFYANMYPGVYYPVRIGMGFSLLVSVSTGANLFMVLSSAGSASVLQWGVLPALELQYAIGEKTSLYLGSGINFTFDPNGILKFVPINLGLTRRF